MYLKIAAGLTTGGVAIAIASPTDLVKVGECPIAADRQSQYNTLMKMTRMWGVQVRMQSEGKLPEGTPKKYPNAFKAYGIIARYSPTHSE